MILGLVPLFYLFGENFFKNENPIVYAKNVHFNNLNITSFMPTKFLFEFNKEVLTGTGIMSRINHPDENGNGIERRSVFIYENVKCTEEDLKKFNIINNPYNIYLCSNFSSFEKTVNFSTRVTPSLQQCMSLYMIVSF